VFGIFGATQEILSPAAPRCTPIFGQEQLPGEITVERKAD
jgi:hypothetical protein